MKRMKSIQMLGSKLDRPRFHAFLLHLGMSLALIAAVFAPLYLVWFPHALAAASGGLEGLTIVAAVDVVLGPLLTFVIYDVAKSKSHLARDIGIIVFLQLSCLFAGVFVVYEARPLAIVHVFDTFHVLSQPNFDALDLDSGVLNKFSGNYPKMLYVDVEKNSIAFFNRKILDELNNAPLPQFRPDLYRDMPRDSVQAASILQETKADNSSDCTVQNIESAYTAGAVCFNTETFKFTDFIEGTSISLVDDIKARMRDPVKTNHIAKIILEKNKRATSKNYVICP